MINFKNILVVAAHPDDEILGCGATLALLKSYGAHVSVLILGEGPMARVGSSNMERNKSRQSAEKAASILGVDKLFFADFPDNKFDTIPLLDIVYKIEAIVGGLNPDIIFTHFWGDLNIDHELTYRAVMTCMRPLPQRKNYAILSFEVLSSTEYSCRENAIFKPNIFINCENFIDKKLEALKAYDDEMRAFPHPRSYEAVTQQARLRGAHCGKNYAEAFMLNQCVI